MPATWLRTPWAPIPPATFVASSTTNADEPGTVALPNWVALPVQPPVPHDTSYTG